MFEDGFRLLGEVHETLDVPLEVVHQQVLQNKDRNNIWLHELSVFNTLKDLPIALIGGGPSIRQHINEIRNLPFPIMACGSVHDYLVDQRVIAHYCVTCDPDPIAANYLTKACGHTLYLNATQCHTAVWDRTKHVATVKWHCHNNDDEFFKDFDQNYQAVAGGCTVGLRALSIALMMGYKEIHLYGFDSCLGENQTHHAYNFSDHREDLGVLREVKLDVPDSKTYICAGYHLAQVENFMKFYDVAKNFFRPVFHGEGYMQDRFYIQKGLDENGRI